MDADHHELMHLVLTASETLPPERRARVYRALARMLSNPAQCRELNSIAATLIDVDRRSLALKSNILHKSP